MQFTVRCHSNGTPSASGSYGANSPVLHDTSHDLYLGRYAASTPYTLDGLMDEVMITKRSLESDEIQEIHSVGKVRQKD